MRKTLTAAALAATLTLTACSSGQSEDPQAQETATAQVIEVAHGAVVRPGDPYELPEGLSAFAIDEKRTVILDATKPFPPLVVEYLQSLVQYQAPEHFDFANLDVEADTVAVAAQEAARVSRETGRTPAYVYNLGSYDAAGNRTGDLWMIEAGEEVAGDILEEVRTGQSVQLTYPTYEQAVDGLTARIAATENPGSYQLIERPADAAA